MADQKNNPNNPQSELFRRLTRLFSGPIVNWRTQMNRKIRRTALDKYSTQFRSASGQQFKKAEYSPFDVMHSKIMAQQNRGERYVDYETKEYLKKKYNEAEKNLSSKNQSITIKNKQLVFLYDNDKALPVPSLDGIPCWPLSACWIMFLEP